jgi:hypothetical protein
MAKLTQAQKKKLPPELQVILERFNHEPQLLMKLQQLLKMAAQKIVQQSIEHDTFCDTFQTPRKLPNELLKLYGLSAKELKTAMRKIGFDERHRQYDSTYYQTFTIAYLIGLDHDDENIRKLSWLMIAISLWNGRKMKAFPAFCDADTARYVMNYVLQGNHTYKKAGSAFDYIDSFSVPALDHTYAKRIADNLNHDKEGLRKLIETTFSRYSQLFRSMKNAYYKTHEEGKKEVVSAKYGQQFGDGDMVESKESFSGTIERIVDKIEKNHMLKKNVIMKPESLKIFKDKFNISQDSIRKINNWIEDEDNADELKYFYELAFTNMKPKTDHDVCQFDIPILANKITSSKIDPNLKKAKEILDHVLLDILGERYKSMGSQSLYRLRNVIAHAFMIHAKVMLCKKL